jgi:hypothetical protein
MVVGFAHEGFVENSYIASLGAKPFTLFRYNSYFGINTVHYMKLLDIKENKVLTIPQI